jgi:CRISPR-associated protein Csd2
MEQTKIEGIHFDPSRRHDFVFLFDVTDGNANGDPDDSNMPRIDIGTSQGLVTDVCLKRKIRNYIDMTHGTEERNKIYIQSGTALNTQHERAYSKLDLKSTGSKQKKEDVDKAQKWMTENFWDIRLFGAVMTTGRNAGQVCGPIQLTFSRSIDPVERYEIAITRVAITRPEDMEVVISDGKGTGGKRTEMGSKAITPFALYRGHGFYNAHLAKQNNVDREDLALFWTALQQMFEFDRSSARGFMSMRGIYIFSHESALGNAQAHELFERVKVSKKEGVELPRAFTDYTVEVADGLPGNVQMTVLN